MKSIKYLEELSKITGINDSELAKLLGVSQGYVSNLRAGRRVMDDETCLAIARRLEINPMKIIGAACIDRAEKAGKSSLWEVFTQRTATTASVVLTVFLLLTFVTEPQTLAQNGSKIPLSANRFLKKFLHLLKLDKHWERTKEEIKHATAQRKLMQKTI
jgi:DNA-binding transcriptional regulator YdaS (Cro superfamily)